MDFSDDVIPTNTDLNNMNITELTTPAELTDNIINDTSDIIQELEPKNDQKSANKPSPQTRADHTKKITSKRRRNNIYGELTDHIAIEFLKLGGDGLLYDPLDRSWLIGVTEKTTYVLGAIDQLVDGRQRAESFEDGYCIHGDFSITSDNRMLSGTFS